MQKIFLFLLAAFIFFQCRENDIQPSSMNAGTTTTLGNYYVSTSGSDSNDGSSARPWRTLRYAVTKAPSGYTINLAAGTYVEYGQVAVPTGVNVNGAGIGKTILRIASPFYYHPSTPSYSADKYLINLTSGSMAAGNQTLSNFSIDGDSKQLHGGIFVRNRTNVTLSAVKVQNTNFNGIWLWSLQDSRLIDSQLLNCSWGSSGYSVGALNIGDLTRVEVARVNIDENKGYGIKAIGPSGNNNLISNNIHDNHISVTPYNMWQGGSAPNFAIEFWAVNLVTNQFYNNYVDATFSIVNQNNIASTGVQSIRVHHNTFDMDARAKGDAYAFELTFNDIEIDHNYFYKGTYGIVNWVGAQKNWSIHHNTFYALQGVGVGDAVRSQKSGLHNVVFYNNTVEFASNKTMNVIGVYGGASDNVDIKNNLLINNSYSLNYYSPEVFHRENGASVTGLQVRNNSAWKMAVGSIPGGTYYGNQTSDPRITGSGARPGSYYMPTSSSPLINAGLTTGLSFIGSAPDIGALEYTGTTSTGGTTTGGGTAPLFIDSQYATLAGKMVAGYDANAKNQNFFSVPAGNGNNTYTPPGSAATYSFSVSTAGNYIVWARVKSPNGAKMLNVYNGAGKWIPWNTGGSPAWMWVKVTDNGSTAMFPFSNGLNTIKFGWMDGGVQVDEIMVTTNASYVPSGPN
ncbi:MAG TPA: DUF1565 domain-containing protein [Cyclobacteriaceae bacterium]|nr:DUF1565 domain-containing protein [Cyclobacteriaceae bacterium]